MVEEYSEENELSRQFPQKAHWLTVVANFGEKKNEEWFLAVEKLIPKFFSLSILKQLSELFDVMFFVKSPKLYRRHDYKNGFMKMKFSKIFKKYYLAFYKNNVQRNFLQTE